MAKKTKVIEDLGEKIGGARKDLATKTTQALGSAALAGGVTAGIGWGVAKAIGAAARLAPKIGARAIPILGVGMMAYGAYQGGKKHGWKGAALGLIGADALLDIGEKPKTGLPEVNLPKAPHPTRINKGDASALPKPAALAPAKSPAPAPAHDFSTANSAYNAMQAKKRADASSTLRGFQNPNNLAAALAAQGKEMTKAPAKAATR